MKKTLNLVTANNTASKNKINTLDNAQIAKIKGGKTDRNGFIIEDDITGFKNVADRNGFIIEDDLAGI